ncbi:hypothetical protein NC796_20450 [Aliifodinibius sp. S!AR15-10]|uniref:hypothetical protein n=1 Tax=Aliifodinibius sp. S!AR15-10 TaxID=2950437 RepID=UPI002863B340|nr:hypothetical protein [Aliifodinibius sp. S!AR15-10]MDR8393537.1 hypothetical protein [Aliifodinibius sp. S!AR15-10]
MKKLKLTSIFLITVLFFACEPATDIDSDVSDKSDRSIIQYHGLKDHSMYKSDLEKHTGLATLRSATARYHDVKAAMEDGFVPVLPCQENPDGEGGLGIPFLNQDRLDAIIDLAEPEVLFYEPQKNGRLRLIGAEPVVPIALWTEDEPPSLFGQEFHRNDKAGLYGFHMWIWKHNPDGVLAFWHADVSCEFAE